MTFKELFDHLSRYVSNREQRWKHVMRVKRGLVDPNDLGGYGKDQCYFEGAVQLLRDVDNIDFHLLMSGKICADEVARIKRVVRKDILQIPSFMKNLEQYKQKLRQMATLNGLHLSHVKKLPPPAYVLRLKQRRNRVGVEGASPSESKRRKVRKRKKRKSSRVSSNKQCKLKVFLPEVTSQGRQDRKNGVSVSLQSNKADDSAAKCKTDLPQVTSAGARRPSSLTQLTSSFSDIRACHGFPAFPVRQPLPPIGTPQEEMAYLSPELDESDSSRHSISLSSLNLEAFLFPVDPIPDPVAQKTLKVLHQEEHSSDDSDDVTTSDDSQEEEEDIF